MPFQGPVCQATRQSPRRVGQFVPRVAAAVEAIGLQDFNRAPVQHAESDGDGDNRAPSHPDVDFQHAHEEERHHEMHPEVNDFIGERDIQPRVGDVARRHDAQREDDGNPGDEADAKKGSKSARTALKLATSPDVFLSTIQIGITLVGILTGTGIGFVFNVYYKSFDYDVTAIILLFIIVVVIACEATSNYVRRQII